jgi:hypothetical protein
MNETEQKAQAPCTAPTGKCSSAKKVRPLTFIAEGYLTRGARRWSWFQITSKVTHNIINL